MVVTVMENDWSCMTLLLVLTLYMVCAVFKTIDPVEVSSGSSDL